MLRRLSLVVLSACFAPQAAPPDHDLPTDGSAGVELDASIHANDAGVADDAGVAVDAPPDAWEADSTPPQLLQISPAAGSATWIGAPVHFIYDEPLDPASVATLSATAQVAGSSVGTLVSFEAPSTVVVTLDSTARGVGALSVHLAGTVADPAGNTTSAAQDISLLLAPWSNVPVDRGTAATSPRLVAGPNGAIYAAWTIGATGSRKLVVSVLEGTTWRSLGGTLGGGDVTSSALTLDETGTPVAAWVEIGAVHVARFTNPSWALLPSPGSGTYVALATPHGGAPTLAVFGSTAAVYSLAGGAWQPLGMDIDVPAPLICAPVLATASAGKAAIGWIDDSGELRVFRYDASWTALAPLFVGNGSHLSVAARGTSLAIAWEQWAGSYGVLAAVASGGATSFTRLGRALDVDLEGDAVAPAVALDGSGNPFVAWTELVEDKQRGVVARWNGSAWSITGGVSWLPSATDVPARTELLLAAGDTPVVATAASGRAVVARFNGPSTPAVGLSSRASIDGCGFSATAPPSLLSQSGCFDLAAANRPVPHAGLVPYDIVAPLWSDGALKRRWIGLPDGQSMTLSSSNGSWSAPVGTIIVKEFDLETRPGFPSTRRPIETRFLINDATAGWQGFSYRWNLAGTDATLQPADTAETVTWYLDDGTPHLHVYPSRQHCLSCHYYAMGPLLGLRPEQLQRWNDYDGVIAPQLPTLAAIGVGPASSAQPFISQFEPSATWEQRMRGYMAANCEHCHNPDYISIKDLRYSTPLAQTKLCEVIIPGDPTGSIVYQKVTSRPGMPPLGTAVVDPLAAQMLGNWISEMTSCP
ncbi:MAG TPA: hypothetical protein VLB44_03995 [Kofleriaceae bacterium]|nr:hypothetical protein [Kofleriaceae bacterium]